MAGENLDFKVRVLGIKEIVDLQNKIQGVSKQVSDYSKKIKKNEGSQVENTKAMLTAKSELQKLRKEYREGTKEQKKVQESTKKTTGFTMKMATAFGVAQLAVDGFQKAMKLIGQQLRESIIVFKEFDFQMQKVKAISGANELEFKRLKESAEELGRTTFFTATQVAELQTNLSKLGFTAEEILKAQDATLATATATGENLARTATVMGSAIRGFGLDASEATRVADVMAVAFTSSALDIEKFQTSMTKVAPIAKMAGFEIEGTTAILGSLTDAGIEASIAGTSLRNILLRLADPTSKLSKRLGGAVSSVDELLPRLKEMRDSGIVLSDVLGITDRRTAAAFGRMLDSSESVKILTEQLRNSEGAALDMANIVGDSLQGAMLRFKSATDGLRIALVDLFGDRLQKAFDSFARFFNTLAKPNNIKAIARVAKTLKNLLAIFLTYKIGVVSSTVASAAFTKLLRFVFIPSATGGAKAMAILTTSVKAFKTALVKTGVGALVVGLGFLIAKLFETKEGFVDVFNAQKFLNDVQKEAKEDIEAVTQSTSALLHHKKELNKLTDEEGNLLNESEQAQAIYNKRLKLLKKELGNVNKINKEYNLTLLTEKSTLEDIEKATDNLITKMKDRMLQESFAELSKQYLQQAVQANLLLSEFTKGVTPLELSNSRLFNQYEDITDEVANARRAIEFLRENEDFTTDISQISQEDYTRQRAARLRDMLLNEGMALEDFAKAIEAGFYQEQTSEIAELLQSQMSEGVSIFGVTTEKKEERKTGTGVEEKKLQETERFNKELIRINDILFATDNQRKVLQLKEEVKHIKNMNAIKKGAAELTAADELKLQKKMIELQDTQKAVELETLQNSFDNEKSLLDQQLANKLISEEQHKLQLLNLEGNFLMEKAKLYAGDLDMMRQITLEQKNLNNEVIEANREAMMKRIADVNNLGSAMIELGGIMGENNKLVQIGTKLQQAAAVATSVATLAEKLNIKTKEGGIIATIKSALAKGGETVANAGAAVPFPLNIAAIAAVVALLSKSLKLFGVGGGAQEMGDTNPEGTFDQYEQGGLTRGGMFVGNSHANGGVKFAVGGRIMEAEGGEAIINKRSTAKFKPILSAINSYNGNGVKFADGGLINSGEKFARGGELRELTSLISQQSSRSKVIMVESDVTETQNRVSNVESQATF